MIIDSMTTWHDGRTYEHAALCARHAAVEDELLTRI